MARPKKKSGKGRLPIQSPEDALAQYESKLRKRVLEEASLDLEPDSKKAKAESPTEPAPQNEASSSQFPQSPDSSDQSRPTKDTWQGFCEIESDPAYFSVILRDLGVKDVTVREVFAMHPDMLAELPQPIYGLILLFRHREIDLSPMNGNTFMSDVWFTNQLPAQNSCATLAMINILMNQPSILLGQHLTEFKKFTKEMTPFQRGEAFASFEFLKRVHNSFAKEMDILENDKQLANKATPVIRKARKGKKAKSRGRLSISPEAEGIDEFEEEIGHHFIAFVPVDNEVWKLDGMDTCPISMGFFDVTQGETWLSCVTDQINAIMAAGDDEYGVIAMAQSPLAHLRKQACEAFNTLEQLDTRLTEVDESWQSFLDAESEEELPALPDPTILGIESLLEVYRVPKRTHHAISSEQLFDLLDRRTSLRKSLSRVTTSIMAEMQSDAEEDAKAAERRFDYGPVIKRWLEMLAENGHLEANLDRFMPEPPGGRRGSKGKEALKKVVEEAASVPEESKEVASGPEEGKEVSSISEKAEEVASISEKAEDIAPISEKSEEVVHVSAKGKEPVRG